MKFPWILLESSEKITFLFSVQPFEAQIEEANAQDKADAEAMVHKPINREDGDEFLPSYIHPGRLTWNLKTTKLKRKIIFQTIIFRFHVNLPGCREYFIRGNVRIPTVDGWNPANQLIW